MGAYTHCVHCARALTRAWRAPQLVSTNWSRVAMLIGVDIYVHYIHNILHYVHNTLHYIHNILHYIYINQAWASTADLLGERDDHQETPPPCLHVGLVQSQMYLFSYLGG